jgi:hypothetical protein
VPVTPRGMFLKSTEILPVPVTFSSAAASSAAMPGTPGARNGMPPASVARHIEFFDISTGRI